MITNLNPAEWVKLCADIEHEPEFDPMERTITIDVRPGILRPQALDLPREVRDGLLQEFATGVSVHV